MTELKVLRKLQKKCLKTQIKVIFVCLLLISRTFLSLRPFLLPLSSLDFLSLYPIIFLSLYPLIFLFLYPLIFLFIYPLIFLFLYPLIFLFLYPLIFLFFYILIFLFLYPFIFLFLYPFILLSLYLLIPLSPYPRFAFSLYLLISLSLIPLSSLPSPCHDFVSFLSIDPCAATKCQHGNCKVSPDDKVTCQCSENCDKTQDPVCDSNGVTNPNLCHMKRDSCLKQKQVTVKHNGRCSK